MYGELEGIMKEVVLVTPSQTQYATSCQLHLYLTDFTYYTVKKDY